jgi:nicotinate-nucleotide adenylyltransferase
MCELAAQPFGGRVEVSRVEEELGGESYTLRTVEALGARHPDVRFSLVMGGDLVGERDRWHRFPELAEKVDFIVVGRGGFGVGEAAVALPELSSTDVRARLLCGEPIDGLVDAQVADYIRDRRLYAKGEP